jgi:hypothetical protein
VRPLLRDAPLQQRPQRLDRVQVRQVDVEPRDGRIRDVALVRALSCVKRRPFFVNKMDGGAVRRLHDRSKVVAKYSIDEGCIGSAFPASCARSASERFGVFRDDIVV